ncbi:ComF family protein [Chitinibacter tainanensis]|uniref:ComF family protein n=1 Tax=Chitinibacter tainanensis TaxID=230667 RepID=UPI002356E5C0|nr:ComF family protein [Chitinibacter tainanensis]
MSNLFTHFLNNFIPQQCLLCRSLHLGGAHACCPACQAQLPRWEQTSSCPRCARPATAGELCGQCQRHPPAFTRSYALYLYTSPIKELIQAAKFAGQWQHLRSLMPLSLPVWQHELNCIDALIPLPLHPQRLRERGFNQTMELTLGLASQLQLPIHAHALSRQRDTEHQARLSARARWKNVRRAFAAHGNLTGQRVLLIDDVMTSGASLHEASRTLLAAGASEVWTLVLARTPDGLTRKP